MMSTPTTTTTAAAAAAAEDLTSGDARANLFPQYLMKLLNDEVAPDALWWLPDGKAFAICPEKIADRVLDKHFQKTKYSSFIRRLHNEGYRRQTRKYKKVDGLSLPEGTVVLSHASFQRDAPELLESFYKKNPAGGATNEGSAVPKQQSALQQAKAAESKIAAITASPNARVLEMLDASAMVGLNTPSEATNALLGGLTALPRFGTTATTISTAAGIPDLGRCVASALYGSYAAQAAQVQAQAQAQLAAAGCFGPAGTTSGLTKSIAALRQARLAEDMARLQAQQQQQQQQRPASSLSRSNSAESQSQTAAALPTAVAGRLSRSTSNESASAAGAATTSVPSSASLPPPPPAPAPAAAILDSQLRLQQLRWENSRRQLEEQTQRLSAMEALRLRAAAAYTSNPHPQWP